MKRLATVTAAGLVAAGAAFADDPPRQAPEEEKEPTALKEAVQQVAGAEEEITVTATRTRRDTFEVPQAVSVVTREEVQQVGSFVALNAATRRQAYIWYDERTGTTSDPIIRGFSGFNLLTLVDGNTLTTLWGEGGFGADDMFGKLEPEMVERIEVIRGPASALYGSNALGAVINVITRRSPLDFTEEGFQWGGRVKLLYGSNNDAFGERTEIYGAGPQFRFLLGQAARQYGDVTGGGDLGELVPSDGRERNWDFSGEVRVEEGRTLRVTLQGVHRDHIKRFYRPFQDNQNDREAAALFWRDEVESDLWDQFEARVYWQRKRDERRFFDEIPRGDWDVRIGEAITTTWQGGVQATKALGGGHVLTAGLVMELDKGDSPDDEQFTMYFPPPKRRAAPLSDWWDWGAYVQDEWRLDERWSLTGALRYDRLIFETHVDDAYVPPVGDPQADEFRDSVGSFTGGIGTVYRATPELHLVADYGRGFRQNAPNFGIRQLGDGVLVPNQLLDPTTSDNFEIGVKARYPGLRFEGFVYESFVDNWQGDLRATTFSVPGDPNDHGSWYDFNGDGVRDANEGYVTQTEGGSAEVHGVELSASVQPHTAISEEVPANWSLFGSFAYNRGRVEATESHPMEEPLRHTQPIRGLLGVRWDDVERPSMGLFAELVADMVGRFDAIPSDRQGSDLAWRRDPQDGGSPLLRTYVGTPGYTVFSVYAGINVTKNARLRVGVENLTDKKYRAPHSRMDAPGIGFVASLEITF